MTLALALRMLLKPENGTRSIKRIILKDPPVPMEPERLVRLFIDNDREPFAEFEPPVRFVLDTTKAAGWTAHPADVARSTSGVEGIGGVPFEVRNGPDIAVVGIG